MSLASPKDTTDFAITILQDPRGEPFQIPASASTYDGFREWARSDDFPDRGRFTYVAGELLIDELMIDMSPERLDTHNLLKTEIVRVIANLLHENPFGLLCNDRILFSNFEAKISTEPDAMFVSRDSIRSGKAGFVPLSDRKQDTKELLGTPDWILEIVSPSSIKKDNQVLRQSYFDAGINEYWLIDAMGEQLSFQMLVRGDQEFSIAVPQDGWLASSTFGKKFKLERDKDEDGFWRYTLQMS